MPGPRNPKKKPRKSSGRLPKNQPKKHSAFALGSDAVHHALCEIQNYDTSSEGAWNDSKESPPSYASSQLNHSQTARNQSIGVPSVSSGIKDKPIPDRAEIPLPIPFIHNPGNGPRVRNMAAFLTSSFALPPAVDDPLCAEFAQDEVREMLLTVLPEETALILWYNKSRAISRICPACQRLYRLGDVLPDHLDEQNASPEPKTSSPFLRREQELSGLCSPVCFILSSFNHPQVIKSAWGRLADQMDEVSWQELNGPGEDLHALASSGGRGELSKALALLVRMTRLADLGLAQLCFPDVEFDAESFDQ